MKREYLEPELEVVKFSFADIMADAYGSLMGDEEESSKIIGDDNGGEMEEM